MLKGTENVLAATLTDNMMSSINFSYLHDSEHRRQQEQRTRIAIEKNMLVLASCILAHIVDNAALVGLTSNGGSLEAVRIG